MRATIAGWLDCATSVKIIRVQQRTTPPNSSGHREGNTGKTLDGSGRCDLADGRKHTRPIYISRRPAFSPH